MDHRQDWTFGTNRAWLEPPDMLWAQFRGVLDLESARWSASLYQGLGTFQPIYLLADITGSRHTSEGRKHLAEHNRPEWFHAIVYIGASAEQRAVSTGFMLAFLKGGKQPCEFVYMDTPEQAREWVAQHRARRQQAP